MSKSISCRNKMRFCGNNRSTKETPEGEIYPCVNNRVLAKI